MRAHLLSYLLGELDREQRRQIEQELSQNPELRQELVELKACLDNQDQDNGDQQDVKSPHLVEQTCLLVNACQDGQLEQPAILVDPSAGSRHFSIEPNESIGDDGRATSWSDSMALIAISLVIASLLLPAVLHSRYRAHVTTCQHNLQQIGYSLTTFSDINDGYFPEIPTSGKRAVAGIYAPLLNERELLPTPGVLICPGSHLAEKRNTWRIPALSELDRSQGRDLLVTQRTLGGSYGYTLGYISNGRLHPPRNERRFYYALMSDSPSLYRLGLQSDNHAGRGQNVLYEDNHIEFVSSDANIKIVGALFKNRRGYAEAGVDPADAVIGRSNTPPLIVRH